ncbi:MAG: PrsW family intramembrane metalloprotease [Clostridia bacterium]|nr:PrsW family intramembrane metalloprotease [Clostridia bacterium]
MNKSKTAIARAKIIYFFKETFRARSKAEYREIFSRGLNDDTGGVSGAHPWLYVRAFFVFLVLFTINVLVLRLTDNALYIPSINFLGGITFTVPFILLLYELYPKRDLSLFMLFAILVGGGTLACVLTQVGYMFIPIPNDWIEAVVVGCVEEVSKAVFAIVAIVVLKQKNPYACFLTAATVGAGFSVIEDMGYIFYYSETYFVDIQMTVTLFIDRGLSSFCTHILWTGAIGWAYSYIRNPFKSVRFILTLLFGVGLHICWDLPVEGWLQILDIALCTVAAAAVNIAIVHISRIKTLAAEVDLTAVNEEIIAEAKAMGERMRFTNAANLTYVLMWTVICVIVLLFCAMPIGMEYKREEFASKEDFIAFLEDGRSFEKNFNRAYDPYGHNVEERYTRDENDRITLSYVIQSEVSGEYEYLYGYYVGYGNGKNYYELDSISVEVETDRQTYTYACSTYYFANDFEYVFDINSDEVTRYVYHESDGSVTAVLSAEEFEGYDMLIIMCSVGCATVFGCSVVIVGLRLKIRSMKDAE